VVVKEELSGDDAERASLPTVISLTIAEKFLALELQLCDVLRSMQFPASVSHIYNPLEYAMEPHRHYVTTYCMTAKDVLFLGINPGPFGMAQTGVMSCKSFELDIIIISIISLLKSGHNITVYNVRVN